MTDEIHLDPVAARRTGPIDHDGIWWEYGDPTPTFEGESQAVAWVPFAVERAILSSSPRVQALEAVATAAAAVASDAMRGIDDYSGPTAECYDHDLHDAACPSRIALRAALDHLQEVPG